MHSEQLAARHFTTSAIHIIEQMLPRAADRSISTEITEQTILMQALWSVLRWERKVGLVALDRIGVDTDALARDVDRELLKLRTLSSGHCSLVMDIETSIIPLLAAAEHEALELGHNWVGSEHLLLAIVRLADPSLCEVLERHRIVYNEVRLMVLDLLHS